MAFDIKSLKKQMSLADQIITPPWVEWLVQFGDDALERHVAEKILELLMTQPRDRTASFGSSSAGRCLRAQIYGYLGLKGTEPDPQLRNIFLDGKWRHLRWQAMLLSAKVLHEPEYGLRWWRLRTLGSVDGYGVVPSNHPRNTWRNKEYGFELKGVSTFQFAEYSRDNTYKDGHLEQVARYFLISGWPLFVIIYEDKTTQATLERVVEANSPTMQRLMDEQYEELRMLNHFVDSEEIPTRLPECARMSGPTWRGCPYGGDRTSTCATVTLWPRAARKKQ